METVKKLLEEQRRHLEHYFEKIDHAQLSQVVEAVAEVPGIIVFTGVGKSGIIAEKIAMTLVSTGTKALYLPPTNFLHGDIGILTDNDLLVLMSRSGETEELLNLIPFARKRRARLLAIVSNPLSRLAKECDSSLVLPMEKELCPFGLAPTTSTAVQLLFGDLLAIALMDRKQFDLASYAVNHPSGAIGKKTTLKVEEVMIQGDHVPLCASSDLLVDMLVELSNKKCGALLVANKEKELLGIFTDGDLRRSLQTQGPAALDKTMGALMTPNPLTVEQETLAWDAVKLMQKDPKKFVMVLPVLHQNKVVGILRMHDLIQAGIA
ncbi:MAG: KpsF/GutQ family sugar-phosphate isomerase [Rhabdochlamydiaceae bacterium]|nr:KpsF/GutQ family sugar-phosphate isomerase [Rhabdochlamydiaceae bacterium]